MEPAEWNVGNTMLWRNLEQNGMWVSQCNMERCGTEWNGLEQNSRHGEGESLELKEVRSIVDPSTALKPVLVTFDQHIGCLKILYYNTYVTHTHKVSLIPSD